MSSEEPGEQLFPRPGERVPAPLLVYAALGALLAAVLIGLSLEFLIESERESIALQIITGVLVLFDLLAGAWLIVVIERRRRLIHQWRSDALELIATYECGQDGPYESWTPPRRRLRATGRVAPLVKPAPQRRYVYAELLCAEAALRDSGAYRAASEVGDARRAAALLASAEELGLPSGPEEER